MPDIQPTLVLDLDGTLVDSAADLVATLNVILAGESLPPVTLEDATSMVGYGARVMIDNALRAQGQVPEDDRLNRLMRDTDAALSRIRMSQMVSRGLGGDEQAHHGRAMDLTMDLPIAVNGQTAIVQMQVGRDPEGTQEEDENGPGWRLRFALDLTETGPMEAAVSLRGGGTYVSLWVDRGETLERLKADKDTLEASFAHAGIDLKELRFLRGLPQRTEARFGAVVDRQS